MKLTSEERGFIDRRARFIRAYPLVGSILLCLVIALAIWLFLSTPLLVNPFLVFSELNNNSIAHSNLTLMAAILPVVFLMCIVLTIAILLFGFMAFNNCSGPWNTNYVA